MLKRLQLAYASAMVNRGNAYRRLPTGDQAVNLQRAMACYQEALRFQSPKEAPLDYALTQYNMGHAYLARGDLPEEDRATSLREAITCFQEALRFWTPQNSSLYYPLTQYNLGSTYSQLPEGNHVENQKQAIACYLEALRVWTVQTTPTEYAHTQNNLGIAYLTIAEESDVTSLQQAISCFQQALCIWTPANAPLDYARATMNLGAAHFKLPSKNQATLQQAIACFQEALRFLTPENAPLNYAKAQMHLGRASSELSPKNQAANLKKAISYYQEALRFLTPQTAPFDYAATQLGLGTAYLQLFTGDREAHLKQAIASFQKALHVFSPHTIPQEYARAQANLGAAYVQLLSDDRTASLQSAILCYKEALSFLTPETSPLDYARTQMNLGSAYRDLPTGNLVDNFKQAIACYREALLFLSPETAPLDYATTLYNMGNAYRDQLTGDQVAIIKQAIGCYQEALRFLTPETNALQYAMTQMDLGLAYSYFPSKDWKDQTAHLRQAITCYQEALLFQTSEAVPLDHARTQHNKGKAYSELFPMDLKELEANLKQARTCYQEALRFWTPQTAPLYHAKAQYNLGEAYLYLSNNHYRQWSPLSTEDHTAKLQQAMTCYEQALRFQKPESVPIDYARSQIGLGNVYRFLPATDQAKATNEQQAITRFQQALRVLKPESAPQDTLNANRFLADLYFTQKNWEAALDTYHAAMDTGELLYRAGITTESKVVKLAGNITLYRQAAFSAAQCGKSTEALLILERGKTRLLSEALRLRVSRPEKVPDEIWAEFTTAVADVHTVLSGGAPSHQEHSSVLAYEDHEQIARTANETLDLAIEHVRVYAPDFWHDLDFCAAQALLPDDRTCLITFCLTWQGSIGLIVTRQRQDVQVVEVPNFTRADLAHLFATRDTYGRTIGGWFPAYGHYTIERSPEALAWQQRMTEILAALGQRLLDPLLSALPPNIERLIFLPSELLFLFPLHAVPLFGSQSELVCDQYQISYAPSLEVLANIRAKSMQTASPQLYAIINPQADPRLVFTPREGVAVATLFAQSTLDEGRTGTKQQVMTRVRGQAYLHFSCHGSYDWNDPTASGLDLADGRLTLSELQEGSLDLSATRLVTLSACETGMTDVIQGSEEYVGVPAGFMWAGVPCVISSLWAVPDLSTALLMERFYHNHLKDRMGFAAALREAQRWVRTLEIGKVVEYAEQCYDQSGRKDATLLHYLLHYRSLAKKDSGLCPFAHPYYWAAFTVNGW